MIEKLFADFVFAVLVVITVAGALTTALVRRPIYPFLGLVTTMFGVAGFYIYLNAPFVAMMQILIYVGAVSILIAFGIMLTGPYPKGEKDKLRPVKLVGAVIAAVVTPLAAGDAVRHGQLVVVLTLMTGLWCLVGSRLRFGSLVNFLSQPILMGLLNGVAITIMVGQLARIFGFQFAQRGLIERLLNVPEVIAKIHWQAFRLWWRRFEFFRKCTNRHLQTELYRPHRSLTET